MEPDELELIAQELRAIAELADDDIRHAPVIAARVLGERGVRLLPSGPPIAYLDGETVLVSRDHPDMNFAVAHELGEWALKYLANFKGTHAERERAANYIAAAMLAPKPTVERAHRYYGERLRALAETFGVSKTSMTLRLAEVRRDERAVVTKNGHVLVRTQGTFPWAQIPVLDVARGESQWRGLAKTSLRGGIDEGRVALRAK
jgi:hypothetical protein